MTDKKDSKLPIILVVFVTGFIMVLIMLLGSGSGHHVSAEHFMIQQGQHLSDFFTEYRISAIIDFMQKTYDAETVTEELDALFIRKNNGESTIDQEFIDSLLAKTTIPIVQEASNSLSLNYQKALSSLENDQEKEEFKKQVFQRLRGFLLDYNKERIRHEESAEQH
ncbi:MAG: hypothetical protein JW737_06400 [Acidobacteria bacterium]|nr:hypothetical protein [Acidobacteriota bacterium]